MKQLLLEYLPFKPSPQAITEARINPSKNLIVQGIIQRADAKNQNGRIYPFEVLKKAVDVYIKGPVAENRAGGELDHPSTGTPADQIVMLKNISHVFRKIWWEGKDLWASIEIMPTPSGQIAKELFLNNYVVGISSRCMGEVKQLDESTVEVEGGLEIISLGDFVSSPSVYGAFLKPVNGEQLNENIITKKQDKYSRVNLLINEIICSRSPDFCYCEIN